MYVYIMLYTHKISINNINNMQNIQNMKISKTFNLAVYKG